MVERKKDESDESYIARLEISNRDLRAHNERLSKGHRRLYRMLPSAASQTALILQCAAEVVGVSDDPEVLRAVDALQKLTTCIWHDDHVEVPPMPDMPPVKAEFGGDVEMIVKSGLEKAKACRGPWKRTDHGKLFSEIASLDPLKVDWKELVWEIGDALADLDMSRDLLRLDLRSAMFDHCHRRIWVALQAAVPKQRHDRDKLLEPALGPLVPGYEPEDHIPF